MWILVVVLLVALMIPITAILLDSPLGRSIARRLEGQADQVGPGGRGLERRVEALETDLEDLNRAIAGMREELQFVQRLLEDPTKKKRGS
jgi:nitrogen fixation/metabolism regulation signal transduction histidine kinase